MQKLFNNDTCADNFNFGGTYQKHPSDNFHMLDLRSSPWTPLKLILKCFSENELQEVLER